MYLHAQTHLFPHRRSSVPHDEHQLRCGMRYFAAPGYHLLVESDRGLSLCQDDAVHFSRPSIDVLFESAADAWGPQVAGFLLTGANEDGSAGLEAIHRGGGLTVIQDPVEAAVPTMPRAALRRFAPDYILPLDRKSTRLNSSH